MEVSAASRKRPGIPESRVAKLLRETRAEVAELRPETPYVGTPTLNPSLRLHPPVDVSLKPVWRKKPQTPQLLVNRSCGSNSSRRHLHSSPCGLTEPLQSEDYSAEQLLELLGNALSGKLPRLGHPLPRPLREPFLLLQHYDKRVGVRASTWLLSTGEEVFAAGEFLRDVAADAAMIKLLRSDGVLDPLLERVRVSMRFDSGEQTTSVFDSGGVIFTTLRVARRLAETSENHHSYLMMLDVVPVAMAVVRRCATRAGSWAVAEEGVLLLRPLAMAYGDVMLHQGGGVAWLTALVTSGFVAAQCGREKETQGALAVSRLLAKLTFNDACVTALAMDEAFLSAACSVLTKHPPRPQRMSESLTFSRLSLCLARCLDEGAAKKAVIHRICHALKDFVVNALPSTMSSNEEDSLLHGPLTFLVNLSAIPEGAASPAEALGFLHRLVTQLGGWSPLCISSIRVALMAVSNFSYFVAEHGVEQHQQLEEAVLPRLAPIVAAILVGNDAEAMVEILRTLGNLTGGCDVVCKWMERFRFDDIVIALTTHADKRVQYNSVGILCNLAHRRHASVLTDPEKTAKLLSQTQFLGQVADAKQKEWNEEMKELVEVLLRRVAHRMVEVA